MEANARGIAINTYLLLISISILLHPIVVITILIANQAKDNPWSACKPYMFREKSQNAVSGIMDSQRSLTSFI